MTGHYWRFSALVLGLTLALSLAMWALLAAAFGALR